ncbi:MAG: hypothetical protein AAGF57_07100 [Pseudomonadota bacterium]
MSLRITVSPMIFALFVMSGPAVADEMTSPGFLNGTVWEADDPHIRMSITRDGKIEKAKGQKVYLQFLDYEDGVYAVKIHWWSVSDNLNVIEYGVLVHELESTYAYIEAGHPKDSTFPGISGSGFFRIIEDDGGLSAEFSQMGRMLHGHASAFLSILEKVDKAPDVPLPQTYPPKK